MSIHLSVISEIIESFSLSTGVPAFLMETGGNILLAPAGYSPGEYVFADQGALQPFFHNDRITVGQYYTLFSEHQFLYNFIPIWQTQGYYLLVSGPMRFHPLTEQQLTTLLRSNQIPLRNRIEFLEKTARLPQVSVSRLAHLGRVLLSLSQNYCTDGVNVSSDSDLLTEIASRDPSNEARITFTLLEEEKYSPLELIRHVKYLILHGDVAGIRALREQHLVLPLNRVDEKDEVISARYRLITSCAAWVGMIFDQPLPYEQLLMILDQYTRRAHRTSSIPELTNLIYDCIEAYAWLVRKYSTQHYTKPVRQVIQYIRNNITARITLESLAELTGLSRPYLSVLIKKETGRSLVELIDSYRIEEGKYLLLNTDYSILQISELTGFKYQYHFSMRFKKYTGMTPTRYRQSEGAN
ncbi:MAG: helix-turn-helix transcriptional regulator [Bacteroidota bacterium]